MSIGKLVGPGVSKVVTEAAQKLSKGAKVVNQIEILGKKFPCRNSVSLNEFRNYEIPESYKISKIINKMIEGRKTISLTQFTKAKVKDVKFPKLANLVRFTKQTVKNGTSKLKTFTRNVFKSKKPESFHAGVIENSYNDVRPMKEKITLIG